MKLRRFNSEGIVAFRSYLEDVRADPTLPAPLALLNDPALTEVLRPEVDATPHAFPTRLAFAAWLDEAFTSSGASAPLLDAGYWAWLTAALFDQACPQDGHGRRRPGADARYIPDVTRWTRRYRHLLANPFQVYQLHRDDPRRAAVVLLNPLHQPGELTEQFTARLELVSCPGAIGLATRLFIDPASGTRRRGAAGAAARRFGKLVNQYTRTWDLPSVQLDDFIRMLPREFNRFKPRPSEESP
jgi:hypothetical protein